MAPIDPTTALGWKNYNANLTKYFCDDKETLADKEKCLEEHSYSLNETVEYTSRPLENHNIKINPTFGGVVHYLTFPDGAFHEEIVIHLNPHLDYFISLLDPNIYFFSVNPSVSVATHVKIDQGITYLFLKVCIVNP